METIKIPDRATSGWEIEYEAEIGHVSTKMAGREERLRWGVNTVWKLSGDRYALYRASMSVLYHRPDTTCRTQGSGGPGTGGQMGSECLASELPDDAEACPDCEPAWPEDLDPDARVRFEFPRQSVVICDNPAQVVRKLTRHTRMTGQVVTGASGPAYDLIEQCRRNDPDFGASGIPMQKIS
jgi:hypothetical protein